MYMKLADPAVSYELSIYTCVPFLTYTETQKPGPGPPTAKNPGFPIRKVHPFTRTYPSAGHIKGFCCDV